MTTERKHDPAWKDATRNERQRRRQAALDAAAQAAGVATWAKLETAVVNGATVIVQRRNETMGNLYLYVIEAPDFGGYDVYIGAVVCAASESEARRIHPSGCGWLTTRSRMDEWVNLNEVDEKVTATRIGIADATIKAGDVIFESYHYA